MIGAFTDDDPNSVPSDFQAVIRWGDGTPDTPGTLRKINGPGNEFDVIGSHTYAQPGTYNVIAFVTDEGATSSMTLGGVLFNQSDNGGFGLQLPITTTLTSATFTTDRPAGGRARGPAVHGRRRLVHLQQSRRPSPSFTASIDWGDGTAPSAGTVAQQANGSYLVSGSHAYAQGTAPGQAPFVVTTTVTDDTGHTIAITGSATIAASLTVTSTADDGPGSLRNVITALNNSGTGGRSRSISPGRGSTPSTSCRRSTRSASP